MKWLLRIVLVALVAASAGSRVTAATVPNFTHVFIIVMENHELSDVIGNPAAPFINSLASRYGLGTAYTGVMHPSLPDYMSLTGGNTFFTDDCAGCTVPDPSIADQLEAAGRTWRAYMEDMPAPCGTSDADSYTTHHNPFIHYSRITGNTSRCKAHVVPLTTLATDVSAGTLPDYVWITPDLCSDMHDCSIATGDAWLKTVVPYIQNTPGFANSVLFIVWDEGTTTIGGGGLVPMLVVSPLAKPGFKSTVAANHYSLLRTIQDAWGLPPLGQSAAAKAMTEFFQVSVTAPPGAPTGLVGTATGSSIKLAWNPPATGGAPTSYVIQAGTAPGSSDIGSTATGSTATTLSATGVAAGTYFIRVAAQNSAGASGPSNEIALPVLVPGSPTALTGAVSGSSITVSWHAPTTGSAPSAYVLEVGSASGLSDLGHGSTGSLATTFSATGVAARTYFFRVRAQNAAGAGAPSNELKLVVGAPTTSRNMLTWPFSADSIWNMPIGSAAVFQSTGLSPATEIFGDVDYFIQLRASDPLTALYNDENVWNGPRCSSTQPTGVSLNIASSLIVPDAVGSNTPNNSTAFLKPDGHTLEQVNALARCAAGGRIYGVPSEQNGGAIEDLFGSGITGGHAGSNLSSIGGTIRLGELTGTAAIHHALKVDVDGRYLFHSAQNPGFRWPANTADACAPSCYTGTLTGMVQGSLLAIPPAATEQTLGLATAAGKKLFHALQDYGAYIVDNSADVSYNLAVENGVKSEFRAAFGFDFDTSTASPWLSDIKALFANLRLVANNGPSSVGGGGAPRVGLAPPVLGPVAPGISVTLSPSATTVTAGSAVTLTWSVSGGTVAIDQGIGSVPLTGTRTVHPAAATTYTLSASTSAGTVIRTATITVH
jgi:hypothetical protein